MALYATLAAVLGRPRRAARLAGAVQAYGESTGVRLVSIIQEQLDPALEARPTTGPDERAWHRNSLPTV